MKPPRGSAELLLMLGSLIVLLVFGALAEVAVRVFSSVDLLGNSKDLFVANAYGTSNGNAPNIAADSFGLRVYTDEHGFRVPKGGVPGDDRKPGAILLLGDSVGFGPAVEEPETYAGLLRARFPAQRIYNSSVIGYTTTDYRNVVDVFVPAHREVKAAVLVYCLNDGTSRIVQNIDRYLHGEKEPAPPPAPSANLTEWLRSFTVLSDANDFLRSRSKLYLFVRHRLLGTQTRDWRAVRELYSPDHADDVERAVRDVAAIAAALQQRGLPFVLVLSPFEYQLRRPDDPESVLPQQLLGRLLSSAGVRYIDARSAFDPARASTDYFLAYDSMHFSAAGHRVMADVIGEALTRSGAAAQ
jgi:lysophospholipase L1-like esterase